MQDSVSRRHTLQAGSGSFACKECLRSHLKHSATATIVLIVSSFIKRHYEAVRINSAIWLHVHSLQRGPNLTCTGIRWRDIVSEKVSLRFHRSVVVPVPSRSTTNRGDATIGDWTLTKRMQTKWSVGVKSKLKGSSVSLWCLVELYQ